MFAGIGRKWANAQVAKAVKNMGSVDQGAKDSQLCEETSRA